MSTERRSMLLMATFVALWTLVEAIAADLLNRYTAYQIVWTRYVVHLALMLALWGWRDPASLWRTRRPGFQFARSSLMMVMPVSWFLGTQSGVPMGTTMAIFWLSPMMILGAAMLFLGERVPPLAWVVSAMAAAGCIVFLAPAPPPRPWLLLAPLSMGLSFALYVVMTRSLRDEPMRANLFFTAFGVFVLLSPVQLFVWIAPNVADTARLVAVGLLGYLTLLALDRAANSAPVSVAAPLCFLQISFTVALGLIFGHLSVNVRNLAALALTSAPVIMFWAFARARGLQESA